MNALTVTGLRVQHGGQVVVEVDLLTVAAGDLAVVAAGGAGGKTSLAAALCGSLDATGDVLVKGTRLAGSPSRRAAGGLAAAVRDGRVISGCTVREALTVSARNSRTVAEVLHRLHPLATRAPVDALVLSGGEQQLLQVACAWLRATAVLVLDSPTVGLADDAAAAVRQMATDIATDGTAVLWLEPDDRAAPVAPAWRLSEGRVSAV